MNKLPIIIKSKNVHFCIVGPTGIQDGAIIKSSDLPIEGLGLTNLYYFGKKEYDEYSNSSSYVLWSTPIRSRKIQEGREFKLLFYWDIPGKRVPSYLLNLIQLETDKIIVDLYNIALSNSAPIEEKINSINWILSPLIYTISKNSLKI